MSIPMLITFLAATFTGLGAWIGWSVAKNLYVPRIAALEKEVADTRTRAEADRQNLLSATKNFAGTVIGFAREQGRR